MGQSVPRRAATPVRDRRNFREASGVWSAGRPPGGSFRGCRARSRHRLRCRPRRADRPAARRRRARHPRRPSRRRRGEPVTDAGPPRRNDDGGPGDGPGPRPHGLLDGDPGRARQRRAGLRRRAADGGRHPGSDALRGAGRPPHHVGQVVHPARPGARVRQLARDRARGRRAGRRPPQRRLRDPRSEPAGRRGSSPSGPAPSSPPWGGCATGRAPSRQSSSSASRICRSGPRPGRPSTGSSGRTSKPDNSPPSSSPRCGRGSRAADA